MRFLGRLKTEKIKSEGKEGTKCKGRVYRFRKSSYLSSTGFIELKFSLRPLKRLSCKGCEKCGWVDEYLLEDIFAGNAEEYFEDLEEGKRYLLEGVWVPGPFEYPEDGDMNIKFVPYPENPLEIHE